MRTLAIVAALLALQALQAITNDVNHGGVFTFVQKADNECTSSPCTVSLPSTVAGNLIAVGLQGRSSLGSYAISDTPNGSYSSAGVCTTGTNRTGAFYVLSGAGGSLTVSGSVSGSLNFLKVSAREYHSTTPVSFVGHKCTTTITSTTTPTSDSATSTFANNLFIGTLVDDTNSPTVGCGSPWTNCDNYHVGGPISLTEDQLSVGAVATAANFTYSAGTTTWMASEMYFHD